MCSLDGLVLAVQDSEGLAAWYGKVLGMETQKKEGAWICTYKNRSCNLTFLQSEGGVPYTADRSSVYWKISLLLQDVDQARQSILEKKTEVSEASQFQDIGFLCHLSDPQGFSIELLQETFEKNFLKPQPRLELALGQPALIGLITLRSSNIEKSLSFYQTVLGMKLLSIQPVVQYGFELYFLAFTDDIPPNKDDLKSVENREWLWQRPYTTLELQYREGAQLAPVSKEGQGVRGVQFSVDSETFQRLENSGINIAEKEEKRVVVSDPDGMVVFVTLNN